ncbi:hypothetical protein MKW94_015765 [Papaver nudicaule]|uniref:RING-CH-type domain-containing protein n=1 Tax=Papaver nudicaule TaxID=74823 RepID=A0AA41VMK1_PAPNU|nr:hypothetical protein [Papaver nudicaule]
MTTVMEKQGETHVDIEQQQQQQQPSNRGRSSSAAAAYEESDGGASDGSLCFSDAEDQRSWHSPYNGGGGSGGGGGGGGNSYEDCDRLSNVSDLEIGRVITEQPNRHSSVSSDRGSVVDLESGGGGGGASAPEINKVVQQQHSTKVVVVVDNSVKDCRICHLSLDSTNQESGIPIELGCSCKEDLAAAHKHCAEAWFKIKGNKTCEICGSVARNVVGVNETEFLDQWNETSGTTAATPAPATETRSFWHGHRFLNFLLACMVFAFVISWLFHFNVPS